MRSAASFMEHSRGSSSSILLLLPVPLSSGLSGWKLEQALLWEAAAAWI